MSTARDRDLKYRRATNCKSEANTFCWHANPSLFNTNSDVRKRQENLFLRGRESLKI